MNMHRKIQPRMHGLWRKLAVAGGSFLYFGAGLGTALADDMDVYVKAAIIGSGSPILSLVVDTSSDMKFDTLASNDALATTLLHQRSYNLKDGMRAVLTAAPPNVRFSLTDYYSDKDPDSGSIRVPLVAAGDAWTTPPAPVLSGVVNRSVTAGGDDVEDAPVGGMRLGETSITMPYRVASSILGNSVAGTWTSSGGSAATAETAYWEGAGVAGNVLYQFVATTAGAQTILLDSETVNTFLYVVDASAGAGSEVLVGANDNRSEYYGCPPNSTLSGNGKCYTGSGASKVEVAKILYVNYNSSVAFTPVVGRYYKVIAATAKEGQAGDFTLKLAVPTAGRFQTYGGTVAELQKVGFFFRGIDIPRGATITRAEIVLTSQTTANTGAPALYFGLDEAVEPPDFSVQDLDSRSVIEGAPVVLATGVNQTVDIRDLIEKKVSQDGWCQGNDVAVITRSATDILTADRFHVRPFESGGTATSPRLYIEYDPASGDSTACNEKTISLKVGSMSEDVNQFPDGSTDLSVTPASPADTANIDKRRYLYLGENHHVGLRFPLVNIPQGATIKSARLKLVPAVTSAAQEIEIRGILTPGKGIAQPFTDELLSVTAVDKTAPVVSKATSWTASPVVTQGTFAYWTDDIAALVDAQTSQGGWHIGSTLGFVLSGTQAAPIKACAWEFGTGGSINSLDPAFFGACAPTLEITFDTGGKVIAQTNRTRLVNSVAAMRDTDAQPVGAAYTRTAEYLAGHFGHIATDAVVDASAVEARIKPELNPGECATNAMVIVSHDHEGANYVPANLEAEVSALGTAVGKAASCTIAGSPGSNTSKTCSESVASMLSKGFTPVGETGTYRITTYTVSFGPRAQGGGGVLNAIAGKGNGEYFSANNSAALVRNLLKVIKSVADAGASVAAPGVSVNALNRFEHLDQLYFALFKPSTTVDWRGNMKRYRLKDAQPVDANGAPALETDGSSFFDDTARSYWSADADGSSVTIGGAAAEMEFPDERRIFTFLGDNADADETTLDTQVTVDETAIDEFTLGMDRLQAWGTDVFDTVTEVEGHRAKVIGFLRDTPFLNTNTVWGGAIHASPRIVTFDTSTPTDPVITVFYGDNRGMIHAIDAGELSSDSAADNLANSGGRELFSFVPKELLKNAALLHENTQQVLDKGYIYGMDGDVTLNRFSTDDDSDPEQVLLYAGMRRGGKNYYALDVSNARADYAAEKRTPILQFVIEGGQGDYAEMGETWSGMSPNRIGWKGATDGIANVLFFAGGYDPAYHDGAVNGDSMPFKDDDQLGRGIYMVDAITGELLWRSLDLDTGKFPAMKNMRYSMTATPRLYDRNADGKVDGMYVVDLAGQVFRFDLNQAATAADDFVTQVTLVAQLGARLDSGSADPTADNRRFYDSPSVTYKRNTDGSADVLLALTSGYREEPANKDTKEAFFMIRDRGAYNAIPPDSPDVITLDSLANITSELSVPDDELGKPGWYFYMDDSLGEKGIGSPVIFNNAILASAYVVEKVASACVPDIGKTRLYIVSLLTGAGLTENQARFMDPELPGIADTPQVIFSSEGIVIGTGVKFQDGESLCDAGVECPFSADIFGKLRRARWYIVDDE